MDLNTKKCKPCEGGISPLSPEEVAGLVNQIAEGWNVLENRKIIKDFSFVNFLHTMDFVNKVAAIAEEEGHHPDMLVSYGKLKIELWTHSIGGLSENDFILAAKIDRL